jgi:hypothetical protein
MKFNLFTSVIVALLLSLVTSKIIYFGFTPNFAADIFSRKAFRNRLDRDVYKYRILSKYLLYAVDDWIGNDTNAEDTEPRILVNSPDGSEQFYLAFYYLNTAFLVLTSIMVVLLLNLERSFRFTTAEKNLIIFLVTVLIGLTEFVVCCYDVSSYFFQLLILYIFLQFSPRHYFLSLSIICGLIILSTLNRESSALSVSMISLLLLTKYGWEKKNLVAIGSAAICFLTTYIALRFLIVNPEDLHVINAAAGNLLLDINVVGLLFWGLFFYLPMAIADSTENKYLIGVFFLFSLPYVITCLKDGILWEVRLYIPLFLGALFLSKLDVSEHAIRIADLSDDLQRILKRKTVPDSKDKIGL